MVLYLIGLALTLVGTWFWSFAFDAFEDIPRNGFPTSFNELIDVNGTFLPLCIISLVFLGLIGGSLFFLREIVSAFTRLSPVRKLTELLHLAFVRIRTTISRPFSGFDMPTRAKAVGNFLFKLSLFFKLLTPLS